MRPDKITLEFGDKKFDLRPLSLGQIRRIEPVIRDEEMGEMDKSVSIIKTALSRDYPDVDAEDLELSIEQVGPMVQRILVMGGMAPSEDPQLGTESQSTGS